MFADLDLDLSGFEADFHDHARKAFADGDGEAFVQLAFRGLLKAVVDNLGPLKKRGIYEQSLLTAFTDCKVNHHLSPEDLLDSLFRFADPTRLREAGEPLPGTGPFILYRGVAGTGESRRLRGYSWTSSLDVACWYAVRFPWLASPAVLTATVPAEDILAYVDCRSEQEFFCKPRKWSRLKMTREEIEAGAKARLEAIREAENAL